MNPQAIRETKSQGIDRRLNLHMALVSPANSAFAVAFIEQRRNEGKRPSSNEQVFCRLLSFDRFLKGKAFQEATPEDCKAYMAYVRGPLHASKAVSSVKVAAVNTQMIMRHALKAEDTKAMPYAYRQAFKVARPKLNVRGAVIPEAAFLAALEAVPRMHYRLTHATELIRALLWLLWDSGMRISELLGLRFGDVTFHQDGITAKLQLREELTISHGFKTGARYVIIRDAVPALKLFMALHPARTDPDAPLLTSLANFGHARGMNEDSVRDAITEVFTLVKSKPIGSRAHYGPHDFRHTAATRDAAAGYREPALRLKYGWGPKSPMPAHYVHLSEEHARARVLSTPITGAEATPTVATAPSTQAVAAPTQRIVPAHELEALILNGWRFRGNLGDGRFIIEGTPATA